MRFNEIHKGLAKRSDIPIYIRAPIITFSSWLFQGILYMDTTEKIFKVLIDILLFVPSYGICKYLFGIPMNIIIAAILAHTFNWIFNGQIFVLIKNVGFTKIESEIFTEYLDNLKKRISKERSILAEAVFGSLSRGKLKETSDLDVRIIRKKGIINGLRACLFVFLERGGAFFSKFPLDIYVLDSFKLLSRLNEQPIILHDPQNLLKEYYKNKEVIFWK